MIRIGRDLGRLFGNHFDAWGITFCITTLCLALHGALTRNNLVLTVAITLTAWLAFATNDYWDAPFDRAEATKAGRNFFAHHPISRRLAVVVGVLAILIVG